MDDILRNNPLLRGMDPAKLNFIMEFANKSKPTNMQAAMPFLLANMNAAKKQNIQFSNSEIQLIMNILCQNLSEAEQAKVKKIMAMMGHNPT